jgi:DNA repair photolyase
VRPVYQEYQPKSILNVHRHVDGWLFDRYSAHPYVGCAFGCEFCYARDQRYLGGRDPADYSRVIRVKTNAAELLRRQLARRPVDVICAGDWQLPAERDYALSRRMLEVVRDLGFPLLLLERSPFVARDLDLIQDIARRSWVAAVFSMSTLDEAAKRAFEPCSPPVRHRLRAMAQLSVAGILTGAALMPILPAVADDNAHLGELIAAVAGSGGRFVLAGGLTMSGYQATRTLAALGRHDPAAVPFYKNLYANGAYGPPAAYNADLGLRVRDLCAHHGLADRLPRWLGDGWRAGNRRLAERLFARAYDLELEQAGQFRIAACIRAAQTVDDLPEPVADLYARGGIPALQSIPAVGPATARFLAGWLVEEARSLPRKEVLP